jgi:hemophore-related protein
MTTAISGRRSTSATGPTSLIALTGPIGLLALIALIVQIGPTGQEVAVDQRIITICNTIERHMMSRWKTGRSAIAIALGVGGILTGGAAVAAAEPLPAPPPLNCTAADLAGVSAGVTSATSSYLFTHPEVNAFFTGLKGLPREELKVKVQEYADANPQVKAELQGIRQPMVDFRNRCG